MRRWRMWRRLGRDRSSRRRSGASMPTEHVFRGKEDPMEGDEENRKTRERRDQQASHPLLPPHLQASKGRRLGWATTAARPASSPTAKQYRILGSCGSRCPRRCRRLTPRCGLLLPCYGWCALRRRCWQRRCWRQSCWCFLLGIGRHPGILGLQVHLLLLRLRLGWWCTSPIQPCPLHLPCGRRSTSYTCPA